ncbi:hypothetical protein C8R46DRAFT_1065059 [Mycena filopes]|nr:hypothetical protein C8R46DRAFT_1065059 [Mycena filopes]
MSATLEHNFQGTVESGIVVTELAVVSSPDSVTVDVDARSDSDTPFSTASLSHRDPRTRGVSLEPRPGLSSTTLRRSGPTLDSTGSITDASASTVPLGASSADVETPNTPDRAISTFAQSSDQPPPYSPRGSPPPAYTDIYIPPAPHVMPPAAATAVPTPNPIQGHLSVTPATRVAVRVPPTSNASIRRPIQPTVRTRLRRGARPERRAMVIHHPQPVPPSPVLPRGILNSLLTTGLDLLLPVKRRSETPEGERDGKRRRL